MNKNEWHENATEGQHPTITVCIIMLSIGVDRCTLTDDYYIIIYRTYSYLAAHRIITSKNMCMSYLHVHNM